MNRYHTRLICALYFIAITTLQGLSQDTASIKRLTFLADSLMFTEPAKSLGYGHEARNKALALDHYELIKLSTQNVSDAHWYLENYDSTDYYNELRIQYATNAEDLKTLGDLRTEYAVELNRTSRYPEALRDFQKALFHYRTLDRKEDIGFVMTYIGIVHHNTNTYDSAMHYFTEAVHLHEVLGDKIRQGSGIESMAIVQKQLGAYDESIDLHKQSRQIFTEAKDTIGLMQNANNLGIVYKTIGSYEKALVEYAKLYDFATALNNQSAIMGYFINSAILNNHMSNFSKAEELARKGIKMAVDQRVQITEADGRNSLAKSLLQQDRLQEALKEINTSIDISKQIGSLEKEQTAHEIAKDINLSLQKAPKAVYHLEQMQIIKDSIFQLERIKQVNQLQTQYETAKKDAAITLLTKNAEIDTVKKQRLWGGLALLSITSLAFIYGLSQRSKKQKALITKEKEIEAEKREKAEQQLEFKKKELLAKVLQLSKKNEFLNRLEQEVTDLKVSIGSSISQSTDRIDRMITNDTIDAEEWSQFSKEFSSVHEDFIQKITQRFGSFSQSEMRLASLLKMNLSSKEVANILRISDEGIKKARYRLRKKMDLETGDDLQGIILSI